MLLLVMLPPSRQEKKRDIEGRTERGEVKSKERPQRGKGGKDRERGRQGKGRGRKRERQEGSSGREGGENKERAGRGHLLLLDIHVLLLQGLSLLALLVALFLAPLARSPTCFLHANHDNRQQNNKYVV